MGNVSFIKQQLYENNFQLVHSETTQKRTKREEVGGKEVGACWLELPLLARLETSHQKDKREANTVNRSVGEIYKRVDAAGSGGGEREGHWDTEKEGVLHY